MKLPKVYIAHEIADSFDNFGSIPGDREFVKKSDYNDLAAENEKLKVFIEELEKSVRFFRKKEKPCIYPNCGSKLETCNCRQKLDKK